MKVYVIGLPPDSKEVIIALTDYMIKHDIDVIEFNESEKIFEPEPIRIFERWDSEKILSEKIKYENEYIDRDNYGWRNKNDVQKLSSRRRFRRNPSKRRRRR